VIFFLTIEDMTDCVIAFIVTNCGLLIVQDVANPVRLFVRRRNYFQDIHACLTRNQVSHFTDVRA